MNRLIINSLSSFRIIFGLLFLYIVLFNCNIYFLMIIFILTVISDILDGYFAKKYDLITENGSWIDVICDFLFIFMTSLSVVLIGLAPFWFIFVIVLKLMEFFITSGKGGLKYDKFGTYVAYMFYVFPMVAILINSKDIILILSIIITVCAIASSLKRIKNMSENND